MSLKASSDAAKAFYKMSKAYNINIWALMSWHKPCKGFSNAFSHEA